MIPLAFIRGLVLGLVAGVPLGPTSATVVDTALRRTLTTAIGVGIGGALVDFAYCQLVVAGLGVVFEDRPVLSEVFLAAGGLILIVYGVITARTHGLDPAARAAQRPIDTRSMLQAIGKGVLISVVNPALMVSWVLLAGTVLAGMSLFESFVAGVGVFLGTFFWFAAIAWLAHQGRLKLGNRAVWIARVAGILLLAYGVFLVGKVGFAWAMAIL